jgi:Domain of unknown function (DUF3291)
MPYELAQVNIGRMRAPIDSDQLKGFVELLDPINAVADQSPGFVWRLQGGRRAPADDGRGGGAVASSAQPRSDSDRVHAAAELPAARSAVAVRRRAEGRLVLPGVSGDEFTCPLLERGRTKLVHPHQGDAAEDEHAAEELQAAGQLTE